MRRVVVAEPAPRPERFAPAREHERHVGPGVACGVLDIRTQENDRFIE